MEKNSSVLVLLSTYCGAKFLSEQLDSLFNQENVSIDILIRDDGSNDNGATQCIIKKFQERYPGKIKLIKGENIGWMKSFLELIRIASKLEKNFDYYAFCDQDDIWLPNKLYVATTHLTTDSKPRLYCSNLFYYSNEKVGDLIKNKHPNITLENSLIRNQAIGCTIVFNRALLDLLKITPKELSVPHDFWAYQVAMFLGTVYFDPNGYIWYRQHENNQIGAKITPVDRIKRRVKNIKSILNTHTREIMAQELISLYKPLLTKESIEIISGLANYRKSLWSRILFLRDKSRYFNGTTEIFVNTKIILVKI